MELFRARDVAAQTKLSERKVWDLIATGELRSVKIGSSRRVPAEALDEYISGLSNGTPDASAAK